MGRAEEDAAAVGAGLGARRRMGPRRTAEAGPASERPRGVVAPDQAGRGGGAGRPRRSKEEDGAVDRGWRAEGEGAQRSGAEREAGGGGGASGGGRGGGWGLREKLLT